MNADVNVYININANVNNTYTKTNKVSCTSAHLHPQTMVRGPKSTVPAQRSTVQCSVGRLPKGLQ